MNILNTAEQKALKKVESLDAMADIAVGMLGRMPQPVVQVCGPMSTGGLNDLKANMHIFACAIEELKRQNYIVFDQTVFQEAVIRLVGIPKSKDDYPKDLLEIFYRRIFESGFVQEAWFLPEWETSRGARWERNLIEKLGITIREFPAQWLVRPI